MRLDRILCDYAPGASDATYLVDVATRLSTLLLHPLDKERTLALINVLGTSSVRFRDGFVVSDHTDLSRVLGYFEAEHIGAALCEEPSEPYEYWHAARLLQDNSSKAAVAAYDAMLREIRSHPSVECVE